MEVDEIDEAWPRDHAEVTLHLVIPLRSGAVEMQRRHPNLLILWNAMPAKVIVAFVEPS